MKTLSIYYIATSSYKDGFEHFKKNLHLFFPELKKTVIILSDGLEEWNDVEENGITYKRHYIQHFSWPIVTLFKMNYMLDYWTDSDYVCYFNADLQYNPDYDFSKNTFDLNKFNGTTPISDNKNIEFVSVYEDGIYRYIAGGFFLGPNDLVKNMCEYAREHLEVDLKNYIIRKPWHEEAYLNDWSKENYHLMNIDSFMCINEFKPDYPLCIIQTINKPKFNK